MSDSFVPQKNQFSLKLGLIKIAQIDSTCVVINQRNVNLLKPASQIGIDELLFKANYLKIDGIDFDFET